MISRAFDFSKDFKCMALMFRGVRILVVLLILSLDEYDYCCFFKFGFRRALLLFDLFNSSLVEYNFICSFKFGFRGLV
jgi:hypothetical protein